MLNKIICGDVVPSRHLEKQMIEVLEIKPHRVKNLSSRRKSATAAKKRASSNRKAA